MFLLNISNKNITVKIERSPPQILMTDAVAPLIKKTNMDFKIVNIMASFLPIIITTNITIILERPNLMLGGNPGTGGNICSSIDTTIMIASIRPKRAMRLVLLLTLLIIPPNP